MPTVRLKKRRRREKLKSLAESLAIIFSGTVFVLAGIVYLARLDEVTVLNISVEGEKLIEATDVTKVAREVLSGSYVFLPRRNIFIYPKKELIASLAYSFPRIKKVDVKRVDFNTLKIFILERDPDALWCKGEPKDLKDCFYVDEDGFIYAEAPFFSGDVFFRYYGGDINSSNPLRNYLVTSDWISELKNFNNYLEDLKIKARGAHLKEDYYEILLANDSRLFLKYEDSLEESFSRLQSLLRGSEYSFVDSEGPTFRYVDLRFGERVYYKFEENE
jgi:hypothetical protein